MKTFPLQSLTLIEAQQKQFALVDTICRHFPGCEFLTCGDLGLTPGLNQPRITQRVEQVLADAFHAQAAALVQGAGTGAIRAALAALLKSGQRLLVHDAPVYPTTRVIIEQMGLTLITADFNDLSALKQVVDEQQPDAALVQHTRQQPQDRYVLADVLATLRAAARSTKPRPNAIADARPTAPSSPKALRTWPHSTRQAPCPSWWAAASKRPICRSSRLPASTASLW